MIPGSDPGSPGRGPDTVRDVRDGWGVARGVGLGRAAVSLPTMQSSTWRSMRFGDDNVQIGYDDPHFCYNCDYIVGVFGYRNASYLLLVGTAEDMVVKLMVSCFPLSPLFCILFCMLGNILFITSP